MSPARGAFFRALEGGPDEQAEERDQQDKTHAHADPHDAKRDSDLVAAHPAKREGQAQDARLSGFRPSDCRYRCAKSVTGQRIAPTEPPIRAPRRMGEASRFGNAAMATPKTRVIATATMA